jgi:Methane oxygenase PmoA
VTNGGPTGLYPHHRGLMYAFNKITYDGGKKKADTWHCTNDAYQSHEGFLSSEGGPVLGRHRVAVGWHGPKKEEFAREERELTVYKVPGGTLVEFASRLKTLAGPVRLDGDPQHAGFQFRASDEMSKTGKKFTYYLRPDGKGEMGETRNWEPKTGKGPVDLPWDVMSFELGGKRYSVEYVSGPKNTHPERYSERDYGRFGCYFAYDLTEDRPLLANYRVWLQDGEMTAEQAETLRRAFVTPPQATVKGGN